MKSNSFVERTIIGGLSFLKDAISAQDYALKAGFLQSLDPGAKIITFLLLILQALFSTRISTLFWLYLFCLALAFFSKINLWFFLKRTWIFIPLFSLFIAIPALFGPGDPWLIVNLAGARLIITRQGSFAAAIFVIRLLTCLSWVVLLGLTTKHFVLLKALRIFGIPQIFIMVLGMTYRYIYLFIGIVQNTYLAIKSRIGCGVKYQPGQEIVAWNIAGLWYRSVGMNEEVYKAMLSRGWSGQALSWDEFKLRAKDGWWFLLVGVLLWIIWFLK
jgi:cobalt/nickel transport system permease protein